MKKLRKALDRIPRKVRIGIDLLLAAALLLGVYIASDSPPWGVEASFRRAERAAMVGPSVLLDRLDMRSDWPDSGYQVLLIGDDGDEILFDSIRIMRSGRGGRFLSNSLVRREKTDGILLTVPPVRILPPSSDWSPGSVPLLLFADDPAAVRAAITITLSDGKELTMSQVRGVGSSALFGEDEWIAGCVRDRNFLFEHRLTAGEWNSDWIELMETNAGYPSGNQHWPAMIELFDADNRLIRTVDYTIRSRVEDARAAG